jgi:hypothetical protein
MSDINANIVVSPIDLAVTVNTNQLSFTPNGISLQFYTGGLVTANSLNANINNVHISGGTNGYVLQTDGAGNLNWTAMTGNGGGGNGTPAGANSQIQYNNSGAFGANTGFTFVAGSGNLNVPGNVVAPNFIGNATFALLAGNATVASTANTANTANVANIANIAYSVSGSNVSGQVANSLIAGTVYTNAQPNITSVGTLSNLSITGNLLSGNANLGNLAKANYFQGDGSLLTNATANLANFANYAGNVTVSSQPNITTTGTLTTLTVTGNATFNSAIFIESGCERLVANVSAPTGTITMDLTTSATTFYYANVATGNMTLNVNNLSNVSVSNSSTVVTLLYINGATPYQVTAFQVGGIPSTINWAGGAAPNVYAYSTMVYTFTLLNTSGYTVLGTGTRYS